MTSPATDRAIAPHLREPIFRAYEGLLFQAITNWPKETSFDIPKGVASATFLANFRNSIVSYINYNWTSDIDGVKLKALRESKSYIICYKEDGKLHFCHPKTRATKAITTTSTSERKLEDKVPSSAPLESSLVPWRDWTEGELEALVTLLDKQRISGPVFLDGRVDDSRITHYQSLFNVAILYDDETKRTIVT